MLDQVAGQQRQQRRISVQPRQPTPGQFRDVGRPGVGAQVRAAEQDLAARHVVAPERRPSRADRHDGPPAEIPAPLVALDAVPSAEAPPRGPLLPDRLARHGESQPHAGRSAGRGDLRAADVAPRDARRVRLDRRLVEDRQVVGSKRTALGSGRNADCVAVERGTDRGVRHELAEQPVAQRARSRAADIALLASASRSRRSKSRPKRVR